MQRRFHLTKQALPKESQTCTSRKAATNKTNAMTTTHSSINSMSTASIDANALTSSVLKVMECEGTESEKYAPQLPMPSLPVNDEDDRRYNRKFSFI